MGKYNQSFSKWLARRYDVRVRDMNETRFPWLWRTFSSAKGLATKGKEVFLSSLDSMRERDKERRLCHEILGHILTQREYSWAKYLWLYAFSREFRRKEVVPAYIHNMEWMHMHGEDISDYPKYRADRLYQCYRIGKKQRHIALAQLTSAMHLIRGDKITTVREHYALWEKER